MIYLKTTLIGIICFVVGLTAPFVVPFALLFTCRYSGKLPRAFAWYDTPDVSRLSGIVGLDEAAVLRVYDKYGEWAARYFWYGLRNRAHGFDSLFSSEAPSQWEFLEGYGERGDKFYWRKHFPIFNLFAIHASFGWQVYSSKKYPSGYEYRPQAAVKTRRIDDQ